MSSPSGQAYRAVLVLPARNEALVLERSLRSAHATAARCLPTPWLIVLSVNDSIDGTLALAEQLAATLPNVAVRSLVLPGKGRAIREAWMSITADYYFFCDVDLSVDLAAALPLMLRALAAGADIAAGSRVLPGAVVERPLYRRTISAGYRRLARLITGTRLSDLPCGCKAVSRRVVNALLPQVVDQNWFFDSELLLLAEAQGYRVVEVPVAWLEYRYPGRVSNIPLLKISWHYLKSLQYVSRYREHAVRQRTRRRSSLSGRS